MTHHAYCLDRPAAPVRAGLRRVLANALRNAACTVMTWHRRYRQRRQLLTLSDHMLKDIGISRAEAEHEGSKAFWE